jgi:hypothetical protein
MIMVCCCFLYSIPCSQQMIFKLPLNSDNVVLQHLDLDLRKLDSGLESNSQTLRITGTGMPLLPPSDLCNHGSWGSPLPLHPVTGLQIISCGDLSNFPTDLHYLQPNEPIWLVIKCRRFNTEAFIIHHPSWGMQWTKTLNYHHIFQPFT